MVGTLRFSYGIVLMPATLRHADNGTSSAIEVTLETRDLKKRYPSDTSNRSAP